MKRIEKEGLQYGMESFDTKYLEWGFHDVETQRKEAESILHIVDDSNAMNILDIACGRGTHDVYWAKRGHKVTGVDLSETFISEAQKNAAAENVQIDYAVSDLYQYDFRENQYDLVTWIENAFLDKVIFEKIFKALKSHGVFINDVRNPNHPKIKKLNSSYKTWSFENGVYYLVDHDVQKHVSEHVTIDINTDTVTIQKYEAGLMPIQEYKDMLFDAGFREVKLFDIDGNVYDENDEEVYWLWLCAYK